MTILASVSPLVPIINRSSPAHFHNAPNPPRQMLRRVFNFHTQKIITLSTFVFRGFGRGVKIVIALRIRIGKVAAVNNIDNENTELRLRSLMVSPHS